MKKIIITLLLSMVAMTAFAQKSQPQSAVYKESSARNIEPVHSVMVTPLIADLKITGDKISYTEAEEFDGYIISQKLIDDNLPGFKKIALSRAAQSCNADAIVGATLDVKTNEKGFIEITITGYPAKYVNWRNATQNDVDLVLGGMNAMRYSNSNVLEAVEEKDAAKGRERND